VYSIGSGLTASVLTVAVGMLWEGLFSIATPFKLLELSAPGETLIQKLILNAAGTYHHSLIVSNMSEMACDAIGANALLARVGSYYHDIGKADKANYFRENQRDGENPHDNIAPEVSSRIIKNHVRDGEHAATAKHLPPEVTEFIITHHGTSEITYFKREAEKDGYTGDEDFIYHGKLPSTRETTIVMLADSIEAAVRSMDFHDEESMRTMIEGIVAKKMSEGQMAESAITFAELETVKKNFLSVLKAVYHGRIKYPDQEDNKDK
jgi:putative nucleotidyltransferase with HDIG domain